MTTNLEQMAKQVSLVNRLIELLRMQEEIAEINLEYFGWVIPTEEPRRSYDRYVYEICKGISMDTLSSKLEAILNKYGRSLIE
jgi:hypothetical protein